MNLALDTRRSISVAASAGSGKTWQLVSRIVRLLLDGAEPGGILALTFTRRAAAEMRERVTARLRALAYADDQVLDAALGQLDLHADAALRRRARGLHEQLVYAPFGLRAQTLHGFCQDVLTRFALEARTPAGFTLAEDESELRAAAIIRLLEAIRVQPQGAEAHALNTLIDEGSSEWTIRQWLMGFIERRSDWWAFTETWADQGEDAAAAASTWLAEQLGIVPEANAPMPLDAEAYGARLTILLRWFERTGGSRWISTEAVAAAYAARGAARPAALAEALLKVDGEPRSLTLLKAARAKLSDAEFAHLEQTHAEVLAGFLDARDRSFREATWRRSGAGYTLGVALLARLDEELRRSRQLTFADLEWRTYRLLRDRDLAEWLRYKLDSRIEHLLLDEFQDTNPTQWALLTPLLEEMAAGDPERRRTAFIVGDAKQSIYGFRRANPKLMDEATRYLSERLDGAPMPLDDSRRSAPAIIAFVNALFSDEDGAAIGFREHGTHRQSDWGAVEIAPLVQATAFAEALDDPVSGALRNPLTTPRFIAEDLRLRTEANAVAARIRALVAARLPVIEPSSGAARALGWGDVMILARQRTHLHAIERALAEAGVPFVGSSRGTLLDTVIARDLMALLRFLDAPHRDLELAHALRSPLFGASDEDLVLLAGTAGKSWWQRLQAVTADGNANPMLSRASRLLADWQSVTRRLPAHDLLDRICNEANAAARYEAAQPGDARTRANLGAFMQLVLDADQGRYPTLGRLNRLLEARAAAGRDAPDEAPPAAAENQVRVLTIHAAKGLEAPAVFLVNAAPGERAAHGGWLVEWPSDSAKPTHFLLAGNKDQREALSRQLIEAKKERERREALNLIYVAVTRARQFLFVSAFGRKGAISDTSWHARCLGAVETLPKGTPPLPGAPDDAAHYCAGAIRVLPAPLPTERTSAADDARLRRPLPQSESAGAAPSGGGPLRDADAATRGRGIHWLLQQLAEGRLGEVDSLPSRLTAALNTAFEESLLSDWLAEARAVFASPALATFFDPKVSAWNEVPVQWLADGESRGGVIDRLIDDGNTLWIVDYKTAPRPDAETLAPLHRAQLEAYADAVARLWPARAIHAGLILTATASWVELLRR